MHNIKKPYLYWTWMPILSVLVKGQLIYVDWIGPTGPLEFICEVCYDKFKTQTGSNLFIEVHSFFLKLLWLSVLVSNKLINSKTQAVQHWIRCLINFTGEIYPTKTKYFRQSVWNKYYVVHCKHKQFATYHFQWQSIQF